MSPQTVKGLKFKWLEASNPGYKMLLHTKGWSPSVHANVYMDARDFREEVIRFGRTPVKRCLSFHLEGIWSIQREWIINCFCPISEDETGSVVLATAAKNTPCQLPHCRYRKSASAHKEGAEGRHAGRVWKGCESFPIVSMRTTARSIHSW